MAVSYIGPKEKKMLPTVNATTRANMAKSSRHVLVVLLLGNISPELSLPLPLLFNAGMAIRFMTRTDCFWIAQTGLH